MPLDIDAPVFVAYRDEEGNEDPSVGYEILPRLSWGDLRDYLSLIGTVDIRNNDDMTKVAEFLIDRAFVCFRGIRKGGVDLPRERWAEAPQDLLMQMIRELQRRNVVKNVSRPNSETPSASSSEVGGEASPTSSQLSSEPSSNTPNSSPTE